MSLVPGTRLGPYEIVGPLGQGGMGEVHRGTDTDLKRDVAIKVLPDAVATDPERLARFQREAQLLAALNHPGIAQIYGVERSGGGTALVMELVEGPTLADVIAGHGGTAAPVAVSEALEIARQVADALQAAHEEGIVHRDLKPANIKVRPDGTVKVLDFGLAKALEADASGEGDRTPDASHSPTLTSPALTQMGMILGTAAYMSPEQARGRRVDKRTDIWAFGCVLFEMLTGRRAFPGEDVTDTVAAVVKLEPDWTALGPDVPARVRQVLRVCLQKDPKRRGGDIAAIRLALEGAFETQPAAAAPPTTGASRRWILLAAAVTGAAGLLAGLIPWLMRASPPPAEPLRFEQAFDLQISGGSVAISPDGRRVALTTPEGLVLREMGELEPRTITSEAEANQPAFSPDGDSIAYAVRGTIKRVRVEGGAPVVVGETDRGPYSLQWAEDGSILFGHPGGISRIPATGGPPQQVVTLDSDAAASRARPLPGGDLVLFTLAPGDARGAVAPGDPRAARVAIASIGTGKVETVASGRGAFYLPSGHLVYAVDDAIVAVGFDLESRSTTGGPVSLVQGVLVQGPDAVAHFDLSASGALVYLRGSRSARLVTVDREGNVTPVLDRNAEYGAPRFSPDGGRIAVPVGRGRDIDLFVVDLERGGLSRLTNTPGRDIHPAWTPDGRRIAFTSARGSSQGLLYWMPTDGSAEPEALTTTGIGNLGATSWTPDGRTLVYYDAGGDDDLFAVTPGEEPVAILETPYLERGPAVSPDGRWLAYSSDETGAEEVFVAPWARPGERIPVSSGGGRSPRWSSDGRELFYRNGPQMLAVAVEPGTPLVLGRPRVLFESRHLVPELRGQGAHNYDVSGDGQRFAMLENASGGDTFVVVQNWTEELKERVPR